MEITWDNIGNVVAGVLLVWAFMAIVVGVLLGKGIKKADMADEGAQLAESDCPDKEVRPTG